MLIRSFFLLYWKKLSIAAIVLPFLYRYYLNQLAPKRVVKENYYKGMQENKNILLLSDVKNRQSFKRR
jgi:hypothetical protein